MLLDPDTKIEERHLLVLMSTSLPRKWRDLGDHLPHIFGPHQGDRIKHAFDHFALDVIAKNCWTLNHKKCLRSLLETWVNMSNYHSVEVLSQVLRDNMRMGEVVDNLPHFKTNDYNEKVKLMTFTEFFLGIKSYLIK